MKKKMLALSVIANMALLTGLLWSRAEQKAEVCELTLCAMRGDEIHLALHAQALAALEGDDPSEATAAAETLRKIVEAGARNIEARRRAGFGRSADGH